MQARTCLITGANSGIGKEAAVALASMGASVVMVARDRARGEAAAADVRSRSGSSSVDLLLADLASLADVRRLANDVRERYPQLNVLINNAGAYHSSRILTADGFETTFAVNHLAHFVLTNELLDLLRKSAPARIINVSSRAHFRARPNFDDVNCEGGYPGFTVYGQSKLANVLFTYELARRLDTADVIVNAMHPGVVRTGFGKNNDGAIGRLFALAHVVARPFFISPERGADTIVHLASSPDVEGVTGKYFVKRQAVPSSPASYDEDLARRLWETSEAMVAQAVAG